MGEAMRSSGDGHRLTLRRLQLSHALIILFCLLLDDALSFCAGADGLEFAEELAKATGPASPMSPAAPAWSVQYCRPFGGRRRGPRVSWRAVRGD